MCKRERDTIDLERPRDRVEQQADRLFHALCALDEPMRRLEGALAALDGLSFAAIEKRDEPEERGLRYVSEQANAHLEELRAALEGVSEAARVFHGRVPPELPEASEPAAG